MSRTNPGTRTRLERQQVTVPDGPLQTPPDIPEPLLEQVGNRIVWLCAAGAIAFTVHMAMRVLAAPVYYPTAVSPVVQIGAWFGFLVVVGLLAMAARGRWLHPETLITVALVFEVEAAFFIVLGDHQMPWPDGTVVRGVSWVVAWILAFNLFVPAPAGRAALAAFASAAMGPLALLLAVRLGNPMPAPNMWLALFLPNFVAAAAACALNAMNLRLFAEVERARRMGSYTLTQRLGEGGVGEVWMARHDLLARPAAVKVIRPDLLGSTPDQVAATMQRFRREAEATAGLHSPHSIRLFDFGQSRSGDFYYVMEYLDGMDLQRLVRQHGPQPAARVVFLLSQICHSLRDAHSEGLVHRDVKPSNIHVCRRGLDCDYIKVLDFGLVKPIHPDNVETTLTSTGTIAGTPAFMAPEMLRSPQEIDHRVDIYALGCTVYWALTALLPFEAEGPMEMALQHATGTVVPPSERTELPVPDALDRLVVDCMAKAPADRPSSAAEVYDRLQAVDLPNRWSSTRAREWWDTHQPATA